MTEEHSQAGTKNKVTWPTQHLEKPMRAKPCQYCSNHYNEDDLQLHEPNCAQNPDVNEKNRKLGEIEPFVKTAVLKNGKIDQMYWAHTSGAQFIDLEPILATWKQNAANEDPNSTIFLKKRGFRVLFA